MALDIGQFLSQLRQAGSWESARSGLHVLLTNLVEQVDSGFKQMGIQTKGKVAPPDPPENFSVVASNGTVHAVITHNAPINKQANYFVEAATDSAFLQPHVIHLGVSRSLFTSLPTTDANSNPINWHFRAYSQYPGSDPSEKITFGPKYNPTPVTVGGTAQFTPMPSTGSGTAAPNGQQPGTGFGVNLVRNALGPKRSSATS
jgi:hypothetical protein